MNKISLSIFLILIYAGSVSGQKASLDTITSLPKELREASGMVIGKSGSIWAHNDSGNRPVLYKISKEGVLLKSVYIKNAPNVDWEDLAADFDGNIYIGDFGNNRNDRTNLAIYKVHEDELNQKDTVEVQFIYFSYPDQNLFPPDKSQLNFDMEAMLYIYGNLYLFSKNRTEPFNGICNIYELPSEPGTYVSKKLDSINFGNGPKELFQITAADISPDGSRIALMSYDKMYLLHDVPFHDFTGGRMDMIEFVNLSQKESVIFLNDSVLLISDEKSVLGGGNLYAFNIASYIKNNSEVRKHEVTLSSKEFSDTLRVSINTEVRGKIYYEFYSSEGARVDAGTIGEFPRGKSEFILTPPRFPNGIYMLNIQVGKRPHGFFVYRNNPVDWDYVKKEMESPKSPSQNRQTK